MPLYSSSQSYVESNEYYKVNTSLVNFDRYSLENVTEVENFTRSHFNRHQKRDPLYVAIPLTFLYSFILIAGILGNLITCTVIFKNKYLHTATNYYLLSLALSDLLLLICGLPLEIYYIWRRYPYIFGETFCVLRGLMAETSTNASILTITAFTVERYVAICHPFYAHTLSKLSRVVKLIIGIWITSLLCAIPQAIPFGVVSDEGPEFRICTIIRIVLPHSFELSTFVFFVVPMVIITILYIRIGMNLKNSEKLNERRAARPTMLSHEHQQNSSQKLIGTRQTSRKILKMLVAVVITFFLCWAPFHIQRLVAVYGVRPSSDPELSSPLEIYEIVTYISAVLFYLSTTVNPILYHTMSHKFRDAFKDTIKDICCRSGGDNHSKMSQRRRSQTYYHSSYKARLPSDSLSGRNRSNRTKTISQQGQLTLPY